MTDSTNSSAPAIRRVVTGEARDGTSILASDTWVEPIETALMPGAQFFNLWGADRLPSLPNDGALPPYRTWFPPQGGVRFELITLPPDGTKPPAGIDTTEALAKMETQLPGLASHMDPHHPGMHRTDTIDLIYVASGACVLELDGGKKIALQAGDTVVQNGPRHAWRNTGAEPCSLLTVSLGVPRAEE